MDGGGEMKASWGLPPRIQSIGNTQLERSSDPTSRSRKKADWEETTRRSEPHGRPAFARFSVALCAAPAHFACGVPRRFDAFPAVRDRDRICGAIRMVVVYGSLIKEINDMDPRLSSFRPARVSFEGAVA